MEKFIPLCRMNDVNKTIQRNLLIELISSYCSTSIEETRQFVIENGREDKIDSWLSYYGSLIIEDPESYMKERNWPELVYPCSVSVDYKGNLVWISNNPEFNKQKKEESKQLKQTKEEGIHLTLTLIRNPKTNKVENLSLRC
jgi:hypothetical protein